MVKIQLKLTQVRAIKKIKYVLERLLIIMSDFFENYERMSNITTNLYALEAAYYKSDLENCVDLIDAKRLNDRYAISNCIFVNEGLITSFGRKVASFISSIFDTIINFFKKIINWISKILFGDDSSSGGGSSGGGSSGGGSSGDSLDLDFKIHPLDIGTPKYFLPEVIKREMVNTNLYKLVRLPVVRKEQITKEIIKSLSNEQYDITDKINMVLAEDFQKIITEYNREKNRLLEIDKLIDDQNKKYNQLNYNTTQTILRTQLDVLKVDKMSGKKDLTHQIDEIKETCIKMINIRNNLIINNGRVILIADLTNSLDAKNKVKELENESKILSNKQKEQINSDNNKKKDDEMNRMVIFRPYDLDNFFDTYTEFIMQFPTNIKNDVSELYYTKYYGKTKEELSERIHVRFDLYPQYLNNPLYVSETGTVTNVRILTSKFIFPFEIGVTSIDSDFENIKAAFICHVLFKEKIPRNKILVNPLRENDCYLITKKEALIQLDNYAQKHSTYKEMSNNLIDHSKKAKDEIKMWLDRITEDKTDEMHDLILGKMTDEFKKEAVIYYNNCSIIFSKIVNMLNSILIEACNDINYQRQEFKKDVLDYVFNNTKI